MTGASPTPVRQPDADRHCVRTRGKTSVVTFLSRIGPKAYSKTSLEMKERYGVITLNVALPTVAHITKGMTLPEFFFNYVTKDGTFEDELGVEFLSLEEAYLDTCKAALAIAFESLRARQDPTRH